MSSREQPVPTTSPRGFRLRLGLLMLWAAVILILSLAPNPPRPPGLLGWDKLQHAGAYGLLAWLLARFLVLLPVKQERTWWLAFTLTTGFGVLLEWLQLVMALGRTAEWLDICADSLGAFLACVIFRLTLRVKSGQLQRTVTSHE